MLGLFTRLGPSVVTAVCPSSSGTDVPGCLSLTELITTLMLGLHHDNHSLVPHDVGDPTNICNVLACHVLIGVLFGLAVVDSNMHRHQHTISLFVVSWHFIH